jgi:hypothetical protein
MALLTSSLSRPMALVVAAFLAASPMWPAAVPGVARPQEPERPPLELAVIEGNGAINNIRENRARDVVVLVLDRAGEPVEGAVVTFTLPTIGPGAQFVDGSATQTLSTGRDGRATARGMRPNNQVGQYEIRIAASHGGEVARAAAVQTNAAPAEPVGGNGRTLLILGLAAGGAAAAALALVGGGGGGGANGGAPSPGSPVTITPGTPVFGPPQ